MTDNMFCFLSSVLLDISRQIPFFLPGNSVRVVVLAMQFYRHSLKVMSMDF